MSWIYNLIPNGSIVINGGKYLYKYLYSNTIINDEREKEVLSEIERSYLYINDDKTNKIIHLDNSVSKKNTASKKNIKLSEIKLNENKKDDDYIKPILLDNNEDKDKEIIKKKLEERKLFIRKIINEKYGGKGSTALRLRLKLWYGCFKTKEEGNCFCCLKTIICDEPSWHCGHVVSAANGGNKTINNLRPICVKCNLTMRKQNMYQYMIYKETAGLSNLLMIIYELDDKTIETINKFRVMKVKYDRCLDLLSYCRNEKKMPKYLVEWFMRDLKTENEFHLNSILNYLITYST